MPQLPAPPLTLPVLRAILRRAKASLTSLTVSSATSTGFSLVLNVSLTRCGPFPAIVTFPFGLELWDPTVNRRIGSSDSSTELDASTLASLRTEKGKAEAGVLGRIKIRAGKANADLAAGLKLDPDYGTEWLNNVLLSDAVAGVPVQVRAKVRVTALGLYWRQVQLDKEVHFGGLAGLGGALGPADTPSQQKASRESESSARVDIADLNILDTTSRDKGIVCQAKIALSNPSREISLAFDGPFDLDLFLPGPAGSDDKRLGTATLPRLELAGGAGSTSLHVDIRLDPNSAGAEGSSFLSKFLSPSEGGAGLAIRARGTDAKDAAWLPNLLHGIQLLTNLPPLAEPVLRSVSISFPLTPPEPSSPASRSMSPSPMPSPAQVQVTLRNPFPCALQLERLSASFRLSGADPNSPALGSLRGAEDSTGKIDIVLKESATTTTAVDDTVVELDMHPHSLVRILRSAAALSSVDISEIEGVLRLVEGRPQRKEASTSPTRKPTGKNDRPVDLVEMVGEALKGLKVDVDARASLYMGGSSSSKKDGYPLKDIALVQKSVAARIGDQEIHNIVERVAEPVATGLIESATIALRRLRLFPSKSETAMNGHHGAGSRKFEDATEVELEIEIGGVESLGILQAQVTFDGGLDLEWEGKLAGHLYLRDSLVVTGLADRVNTMRADLIVKDMQRFSRLARALATSESIAVKASCPALCLVVAGVRIAPRPFDRPITVNGLDSLSGLRLESFDLPRDCDPSENEGQGVKVDAVGIIEMKSALELDIEEIEVDLTYLDRQVGAATIRDISFRLGGTSRLTIDGRLDGNSGPGSLEALGSLVSEALRKEDGAVLTAVIRTMKLPDGADLPWLSDGLKTVKVAVPVRLPSTAASDLLQHVELNTIALTFRADQKYPTLSCEEVSVQIKSPYTFPLRVSRIGGSLGLRWKGTIGGRIEIPEVEATAPEGKEPVADGSTDRTTIAKISFQDAAVIDPVADVLESFAAEAVNADAVSLGIDGSGLKVVVGTAAGNVTLSDVPIRCDANIKGLGGIRHMPAQLTEVQVAKGEKHSLKVMLKAWFNARGQLLVKADNVTERVSLPVFYDPKTAGESVFIGRAVLAPSFTIDPGPTHVPISFEYAPHPEQSKKAGILLSDFLSGRTSTLRIRGDDESASSRVLCEALKKIEMDAELKPMADKTLIQSIAISLGLNLAVMNVEATFGIANPFELPMRLRRVVGSVTHRGLPFGSFSPVFESFVVPPASGAKTPSLATSPSFKVKLRQAPDKLVTSWGSARGQLSLDLDIEADVEIGEYAIDGFKYKQEHLPLRIQGLERVSKFLSYLP